MSTLSLVLLLALVAGYAVALFRDRHLLDAVVVLILVLSLLGVI